MEIIGLIGQKRVGKDTLADYLCENHNFIKHAFADPLKIMAKFMFDFTEEQLYGSEKEIIDERYGITPRDFFQKFGTDIIQYDLHKHLPNLKINKRCFWVDKTNRWINNKLKENPNSKIIITDIRFKHEIEYLKNKFPNVKIIKITSNRVNNENNHIAETEQNEIPNNLINYYISNNGSIDEYYNNINDIFLYDKMSEVL